MLQTFKALSDPCRLRLMAILLRGEFTVQELTVIIDTGQSRISHHLKTLAEAGLIRAKRQGTWSYYSVDDSNRFFSAFRPFLLEEFDSLPEHSADLAAIAAVFEQRRRRNLDFFDRHARQWDELVRTILPLPEYGRKLLGLLPSAGTLLEIGIGTGTLLMELAATANSVVGVDHSPAMLEEARLRLAASGVDNVELRLGEMAHLPIQDGTVDGIVLNMVLHHAADPQTVLQETSRALKAKGILLIADLARHDREMAREQLADQWLGFEEDELSGWLREAGYNLVSAEPVIGHGVQGTVLLVKAVKLDKTDKRRL